MRGRGAVVGPVWVEIQEWEGEVKDEAWGRV